MTSRVGCHYQPTLWDALWTCAHPCKFTLITSSFGAKVFPHPNVGVWFWFGLMQESSICPCHLTTPLVHSLCLYAISWKSLAFISFATWCDTFVWYPTPVKKKVMSSSHLIFLLLLCRSIVNLFYGLLGMFHIWFVHSRCPLQMVSFPLDQILPLLPP
jgi:hypothetical protein